MEMVKHITTGKTIYVWRKDGGFLLIGEIKENCIKVTESEVLFYD